MKKQPVAAVALLMSASAAQAGFITLDTSEPIESTIGVVSDNDFQAALAGAGVNTYTAGASLGVDASGSVTYYYYGKEAGYRNDFSFGDLSYSSGFTPTVQNYFAEPIEIGTIDLTGPGLLDFSFCSFASATSNLGCLTNAQNDALTGSSLQSIRLNVNDSIAWLFWEDLGGDSPDHDDMLIKAEFRPNSVPEPATLALFGIGLIGLGLVRFRKS